MSIRRDPIYISKHVSRALWLLSKGENKYSANEIHTIITPDEIADRILGEAIQSKYPALIEGLKELDKKEKEIIESLK